MIDAWPEMPPEVQDRDADVWEALLAVADAAGEGWPERARVASVALVTLAKESCPSLGIRLLGDLRGVFGASSTMPTEAILKALHDLDEAPWGDLRGKPLNDRGLARLLRPYDVRPKLSVLQVISSAATRARTCTMRGSDTSRLLAAALHPLRALQALGDKAHDPTTSVTEAVTRTAQALQGSCLQNPGYPTHVLGRNRCNGCNAFAQDEPNRGITPVAPVAAHWKNERCVECGQNACVSGIFGQCLDCPRVDTECFLDER